jgi:hypothetical protein
MKTIKLLSITLIALLCFASCETEEVLTQGETVEEFDQRAKSMLADKMKELRGRSGCVQMCTVGVTTVEYCVDGNGNYTYWATIQNVDGTVDMPPIDVVTAHKVCTRELVINQ